MLIAATALAENLPLFTRKPDDFRGLASLLEVHAVEPAGGPQPLTDQKP